MTATRLDSVPESQWRSPWEYEYEVTHPESNQWGRIEAILSRSEDPHQWGKTGDGAIVTEEITFYPNVMYRVDKDGPEAYLEGIAGSARQWGAASTEIVEE
jgi:hypothetical protein